MNEKTTKTEKKQYWWKKPYYEQQEKSQWYEDSFFSPYKEKLEPKIPKDYQDPILDEENKLLLTKTTNFPNPSIENPNYDNLFGFYTDWLKQQEAKGKAPTVSILIPSFNGKIDLQASVSFMNMFKPRHKFQTVIGHNIGVQRNQLINMALDDPAVTHVFFWDDDVVMPPYALMRLLRRDMDIVSGIYTMKFPPYVPLAIKRPRNPQGERKFNYYITLTEELLNKVIPIDGAGAGCLLIKREVLEKMGPPWFQVTPINNGIEAVGEDLYFYDKAQEYGYTPMLDLSVQCDHSIGHIQFPRVLLQNFLNVGPRSRMMVEAWNKNAILDSLGLPHFSLAKKPKIDTNVNVDNNVDNNSK